MDTKRVTKFTKALATLTFLLMVIVNGLADRLPINGVTTGQISNYYPNLFAPAGFTFAIWGLIYLLLAGYTLYQLGFFHNGKSALRIDVFNKVGLYFAISSIANAAWIFAWHFYFITLSMLLMIIILICLIMIVDIIKKEELSLKEYIFMRLPFSIYLGWITVATIANATTLLVSLGWNGFGISEAVWTVVMVVAGLGIAIATIFKNRDIAYGLVIIWGYTGILIKHTSALGFAGQYPSVVMTVIICLVLLIVALAYMIFFSNAARKA